MDKAAQINRTDRNVHNDLIGSIQDRGTYAASVRASVNRKGKGAGITLIIITRLDLEPGQRP